MDGLSIKQNVDSAPAVLAGDFDICLAGCHGDGSAFFPDGQAASIVPGEDVSTDAANKLVIFVISHFSAPCFFWGGHSVSNEPPHRFNEICPILLKRGVRVPRLTANFRANIPEGHCHTV